MSITFLPNEITSFKDASKFFTYDDSRAKKAYAFGHHYINMSADMSKSGIEIDKNLPIKRGPVRILFNDIQILYPAREARPKFEQARLVFENETFNATLAKVATAYSDSIYTGPALPFIKQNKDGNNELPNIECNAVQYFHKDGTSLDKPIARVNIPFSKENEKISADSVSQCGFINLEGKEEPLIYGKINESLKPGTKCNIVVDMSTIVVRNGKLSLRCNVIAIAATGFSEISSNHAIISKEMLNMIR